MNHNGRHSARVECYWSKLAMEWFVFHIPFPYRHCFPSLLPLWPSFTTFVDVTVYKPNTVCVRNEDYKNRTWKLSPYFELVIQFCRYLTHTWRYDFGRLLFFGKLHNYPKSYPPRKRTALGARFLAHSLSRTSVIGTQIISSRSFSFYFPCPRCNFNKTNANWNHDLAMYVTTSEHVSSSWIFSVIWTQERPQMFTYNGRQGKHQPQVIFPWLSFAKILRITGRVW